MYGFEINSHWCRTRQTPSPPHRVSGQVPLCPVEGSRATQPDRGERMVGREFIQMVSGKQAPLHFYPRACRQALSTLFNQVSIKAERDRVLLTAGALWALRSKVTNTAASDPTPTERAGAERKIVEESEEREKHGVCIEKQQIWLPNAVYRRPELWIGFIYLPLIQLWTCSSLSLGCV